MWSIGAIAHSNFVERDQANQHASKKGFYDAMSDTTSKSQPPKKKRKPRQRTRRKRDELVQYEMRIDDWDYYYGFRISDPKYDVDRGPYSELTTLTFTGTFVYPKDLKYKDGSLTLSARAGMMDERLREPPRSIGNLSAHGNTLSAYVFVPTERLAELVAVAHSGRVQVASLVGTRLRYRSGLVRSVSLNTEIEDEGDE